MLKFSADFELLVATTQYIQKNYPKTEIEWMIFIGNEESIR